MKKDGLALIELLVVIAVVSILLAILIPVWEKAHGIKSGYTGRAIGRDGYPCRTDGYPCN